MLGVSGAIFHFLVSLIATLLTLQHLPIPFPCTKKLPRVNNGKVFGESDLSGKNENSLAWASFMGGHAM